MFYPHVCIRTTCVPGAHRGQNRVLASPGTGDTDGFEPSCGLWKPNLGPYQKQQVYLITEPSLQPLHVRII